MPPRSQIGSYPRDESGARSDMNRYYGEKLGQAFLLPPPMLLGLSCDEREGGLAADSPEQSEQHRCDIHQTDTAEDTESHLYTPSRSVRDRRE